MHAGSVLVLISSSCQFKYMKLDHLFIISRSILKKTKEKFPVHNHGPFWQTLSGISYQKTLRPCVHFLLANLLIKIKPHKSYQCPDYHSCNGRQEHGDEEERPSLKYSD